MAGIYPYGKFRFRVECDGLSEYFSEVTGFDANVDVYEYREGSQKTTPLKVSGLRKYGNVTLKRAVSEANATELWDWWTIAADQEPERKSLAITLMDNDGNDVATWNIEEAWPVKYTAPDFNATASEAAVETIELAHEGMTRVV